MSKIKIAFDVDGVLLNFFQTTSNFIESHYRFKRNIYQQVCQYNLYEVFDKVDIDKVTFNKIKEEFERQGHWKSLEPMPHIDKVKALFNNPDYEVVFITSIPPHLHDQRKHNLEQILGIQIESENLICVPLGESKKPHVDKFKPHFFVEDNLNNLVDCQGAHQSVWIDLNESYYDRAVLKEVKINSVATLNQAVDFIQENKKKISLKR